MSVTGWLIERADSSPPWPWYWAAGRETSARRSAWTQNPEQAIRFARREDAMRTQRRLFREIQVRIREHAWDAGPSLEPSTREDGLREAAEIARQIITETGVVSDDGRPGLAGLVADRIHAAILARITEGTPKP